jgi:hypothetical protein
VRLLGIIGIGKAVQEPGDIEHTRIVFVVAAPGYLVISKNAVARGAIGRYES